MSREVDLPILPGTFELLLLQALSVEPMHGWGLAQHIETVSGVFLIQQGTVYPVLQRLKKRRLVTAEWRDSDNGRRARFYRLTAAGRHALEDQTQSWRRASEGIERVLRIRSQEG